MNVRAVPALRSAAALAAAALLAVGSLAAGVAVAPPALADTAPAPGTPGTVTADSLPTTQIDGVAWQQAIAGNRVFVGGDFATARPAGALPGTSTVPRTNLLAYDITTGVLDASWAPNPNAQVRAVAVSPDGSRVYVGGNFTQIAGVARYRIAAFDTATGALITSFNAGVNSQVRAIVATDTTVYVGGIFTNAGGQARTRLAAFSASNGAVLPWAPTADNGSVSALAVAPDGSTVVAAGSFTSFNGSAANGFGMARVHGTTGASLAFPANATIRNGGTDGAILGLTSDGENVFGVGYTWGRSGGTLEGVFSASWETGELTWVMDCHGDSYAVYAGADVVYSASHYHYCGNVRSQPQEDEWEYFRANAMTKDATQKVGREHLGYTNFEGQDAPTRLNWFPDLDTGTYTGQNQGPWAVTGNDQYVVWGGEFLNVNFKKQQGLVRFAVSSIAPNDQGPRLAADEFPLRARAVGSGAVRVAWKANVDFDNEQLTYRVIRNGNTANPVWEGTRPSQRWDRPWYGFTDTGLTAGQTYTYEVRVADPFGNTVTSAPATVTADGTGAVGAYARRVMEDGASHYWRLGETTAGPALDTASANDAATGTSLTRGTAGALTGDANTAYSFATGTGSRVIASERETSTNTLSVEAWVKTTSNLGGRIAGFGNSTSLTGTSSVRDRHLYMSNAGRLYFGVAPGVNRAIGSTASYNDGAWHHVVGTLGANGVELFVDGTKVASEPAWTTGRNFTGFWRIGGDSLSGWSNAPSSSNLAGAIDEVAVYPTVLSADQIAAHRQLGVTGTAPNVPPVAAFTAAGDDLELAVDASASTDPDGSLVDYAWTFGDGASGTGATASHTYDDAGTYDVTLTVTDDRGGSHATTQQVTVTANEPPVASFTASATHLTVAVDGQASSDPDGTLASHAWSFGDGATGTGATASHTYTDAGTYTVTLTVTDDDGATASTSREVTVTEPPADAPFALDTFGRTATGGWGSAEVGGAWTVGGGAANFSVGSGAGAMRANGAGWNLTSYLTGVARTDTDLWAKAQLDVMPTGGGTDLDYAARSVGTTQGYRLRTKVLATGVVRASLLSVASGTTTTLTQVNVPGLTYAAGDVLQVRVQAIGTSPTTLRAKVWRAGQAEPAAWTVSATDSNAALQVAGGVGFQMYTSGSTTTLPITARFSDVRAIPGAL